MNILFLCLSPLKFDVLTPYQEPLGGTESALAYLSVEMAKLGHHVTLMRNAPDKETQVEGVWHKAISEDIAPLDPDVVIVTSAPQACPMIKAKVPRAKIILWNHMRPDQPAMAHFFTPVVQQAIDRIVYVSKSQEEAFVAAKGPNGDVIGNAISPVLENMFSSVKEILDVKECRGAYTSTPFRGLAVLAQVKELPIDVFSSMAVYQGNDESFAPMYEALKTNDCIELKGSVSQTELRNELKRTSFLVYPSIFTECHSIAIIEAMAAGLKIITTDMAAPQSEFIDSMPSATGSFEIYTALLRKNLNFFRAHPEMWAEKIWEQVQYINREYTWAKRAQEWDSYLKNLETA